MRSDFPNAQPFPITVKNDIVFIPLFYPFKLKLVASEGLRILLLIYDLNCHTLFF